MTNSDEKRVVYRRYEDRRVAMMLAVHEILFEYAPGPSRDKKILAAIGENYQVDRVAVVNVSVGRTETLSGGIAASFGDWLRPDTEVGISGVGFERIVELHGTVDGALSFESVRKPEAFTDVAWRSLWEEGVGAPARALLSMTVEDAGKKLIWLQQTGSTREWSSRDRDLIEEVAALLSKAAARGI